jgi:hypothetical protein
MIFGKKAQEQRDRIIAYKRVFGSPEGKQVLFDLMNRYHIINSHKGDVFAEGQRSVVLGIMHQCNINLAEFDRAMKEGSGE